MVTTRHRQQSSNHCSISSLFRYVLTAFVAYSAGVFTASNYIDCQCPNTIVGSYSKKDNPIAACPPPPATSTGEARPQQQPISNANQLFPSTINGLFNGASLVPRDQFSQLYDTGVPLDPTTPGNEQVLILHTTTESRPTRNSQNTINTIPNANHATENCHIMKVLLTSPPTKQNQDAKQCIAIMGQWDSYHVHKFMRLNPNHEESNDNKLKMYALASDYPPLYVHRSQTVQGGLPRGLPGPSQTERYFDTVLRHFLDNRGETLKRLKPIAKKAAAKSGNNNTIVVMISNSGQSSLLFNFVCAARARNLDLSHVLLMATDPEMAQLGQELGLHVFEWKDTMGPQQLPTKAAPQFGASLFGAMVMVKVVAAYLINALGYDMLFQDVDVVWYQNPLEYFLEAANNDTDIFLVDDGNRADAFQPYAANGGFYFARHNNRTRRFFSTYLRMGDVTKTTKNEQNQFAMALSEHASLGGLHVQVFSRDGTGDDGEETLFPNGFHFHRRRDYMKKMVQRLVKPYMFHMSWTANKDKKIPFFEQLGDWFLKPDCMDKSVDDLANQGQQALVGQCCSVEPLFKCHYNNLPSLRPCREAPTNTENRNPSFW